MSKVWLKFFEIYRMWYDDETYPVLMLSMKNRYREEVTVEQSSYFYTPIWLIKKQSLKMLKNFEHFYKTDCFMT